MSQWLLWYSPQLLLFGEEMQMKSEIPEKYWAFVLSMDPAAYVLSADSCGVEYVMSDCKQIVSWEEIYSDMEMI